MPDVIGRTLFQHEIFWLGLGFVSQVVFAARFFIQWIASEIKGVSYVPISFWYLSIFGSMGLLIYSIYRKDPVFILGQGLSMVIYVRNIMLIRKKA